LVKLWSRLCDAQSLNFTQRSDTAAIYRNEEAVAAGIVDAIDKGIVTRQQIWLTTKLAPQHYSAELAPEGLKLSATRLQPIGPADLMLMHWPGASGITRENPANKSRRLETWKCLLEARDQGLFRHVGVSNFLSRHLQELKDAGLPFPMVNQVELHPRLPQIELRQFCEQNGIIVQAYSPLGCGKLLTEPVVCSLASEIGRTSAQVLLKWFRQQDIPVVVKSVGRGCEKMLDYRSNIFTWLKPQVTPSRMRENLELDFELSSSQMDRLSALADNHRYCWDPTEVA